MKTFITNWIATSILLVAFATEALAVDFAERKKSETGVTIRVAGKSADWDNMYLYAYGENGGSSITRMRNCGTEGEYTWFTIVVPEGSEKIIFINGDSLLPHAMPSARMDAPTHDIHCQLTPSRKDPVTILKNGHLIK